MSLSLTPTFGGFNFSLSPCSDHDLAGVRVWGSLTSGFTPADATLLYNGSALASGVSGLTPAATYYVVAAYVDAFGATGLNYSTEQAVTTLALPNVGVYNSSTWNAPILNLLGWQINGYTVNFSCGNNDVTPLRLFAEGGPGYTNNYYGHCHGNKLGAPPLYNPPSGMAGLAFVGSSLMLNTGSGWNSIGGGTTSIINLNYGQITTGTLQTLDTTQHLLDTFLASAYAYAKYEVSIRCGSSLHVAQLTISTDGVTVDFNWTNDMQTAGSLGSFDVVLTSGNVNLLFTAASGTTTTIKFLVTRVSA